MLANFRDLVAQVNGSTLPTLGLFFSASAVVILTPGPNMLYIATRSVTQGRRAGLMAALGIQAGVWVLTLVTVLGLSALIAASALAFSVVKYAGCGYLIYLGIRTLVSSSRMSQAYKPEPVNLKGIFYQSLVVSVLNPMGLIFFLAFLPQFIVPSENDVTSQLLVLSIVFCLLRLPVDIVTGLVGSAVGTGLKKLGRGRRVGQVTKGIIFIALGVSVALAKVSG